MSPKSTFASFLEPKQLSAWVKFQAVCDYFLGNELALNYRDLVDDMLKAFKNMGISMSLKMHFLNSHLDRLTEHGYVLGRVSDEQGERFHQEIALMERHFSGSGACHSSMMGDYCWSKCSDEEQGKHARKTKQVRFGPKPIPKPSCLKKSGGALAACKFKRAR